MQGAALSALDVRTTLAVLVVDGAAWGSARRAVLPRPVPLELPLVGSELISELVSSWLEDALQHAQRGDCPAAQHPPPPPQPPPGAFDWRESFLLELADLGVQAAGPGGFDALVRTATHGSGELELPQWLLPHGTRVSIPGVADLLIDVAHANVSGLDSFSKLELLEPMPSDAAGLSSAIEMGGLGVSLELQLSILGGGGRRQLPPLHVNLSLSDVSVAATGRLALDADGIGEMQLRQLANCTWDQVLDASLLSLSARASLRALSLDGADGSHAALRRPVALQLPTAAQELLTQAVNDGARRVLQQLRAHTTCAAPAAHPPHLLDMTDSPTVEALGTAVDELILGEGNHTYDALLAELKEWLGLRGGALHWPAQFLDLWVSDAKVGQVGVRLANLSLSGLDALFGVNMLAPAAPRLLTHSLGVGDARPLRGAVRFGLYMGGDWHTFDLGLEVRNTSLDLATPLTLDANALGSLSLRQVPLSSLAPSPLPHPRARSYPAPPSLALLHEAPSHPVQVLETPGCLASPFLNLSLDPGGSRLAVAPPRTGGIGFQVGRSGHPEAAVWLPAVLPRLELLVPGLSQRLDDKLQRALGRARAQCAHVPYAPPAPAAPTSASSAVAAAIAVAMLAVPLALGACACACAVRRRRRARFAASEQARKALGLSLSGSQLASELLANDSAAAAAAAAAAAEAMDAPLVVDGNDVEDQEPCPSDDEEVAAAWVRQAEEGSGAPKPARLLCGGRAASAATSLSRHPLYRRSAWRAVVPATIFGTAGLFLASALPPYGIGATVDLRVAVAGEPIELQRLFQFTLAGSVHDAWHAGVYPLSLLIALLSGIWPYVKLMLMLACWCAACHSVLPPPSPPGARGCIAPHPFP